LLLPRGETCELVRYAGSAAKAQAAAMLFGRQAIEVATWALTVPGLALLAVTGLFMTMNGRLGFLKRRWLSVHQLLGALIILNVAFILVPVGGQLLELASQIDAGTELPATFMALARRESMFGAFNLILALVTIFVAVLKPGLGRYSP
jgi:Predicted integral membrane protein (DUF2269)